MLRTVRAGQTIGKKVTEEGGGKTVCVIQQQGSVALETRCAGVKQGFANTENLQVSGADPPSVQSAISAQGDTGSTAKVITFDLNKEAAQAIEDSRSSSPSTSSPTCRATWSSRGCGCS